MERKIVNQFIEQAKSTETSKFGVSVERDRSLFGGNASSQFGMSTLSNVNFNSCRFLSTILDRAEIENCNFSKAIFSMVAIQNAYFKSDDISNFQFNNSAGIPYRYPMTVNKVQEYLNEYGPCMKKYDCYREPDSKLSYYSDTCYDENKFRKLMLELNNGIYRD